MQPAIINAIHRYTTEPGVTLDIGTQYKFGFSLFWSFLWVIIIQGLVIAGSSVLFLIPGIIVAIYTSAYFCIFTIDGARGFSAMVQSYELIKGRWWGVLGRGLFFVLVIIGCMIVIGIISIPLVLILGKIIGTLIVSLVASAIIGPLSMVYIYRLYVSLKATKLVVSSGGKFKKWLVAFMIVGILSAITIIVLISSLILSLGYAGFESKINAQYYNAQGQPMHRYQDWNEYFPQNSGSSTNTQNQ